LTGLPDQSQRAAFLATVQGKIISVLAIIALLLSIGIEGISIYTNWKVALIKTYEEDIEHQKWGVLTARPRSEEEYKKLFCIDHPETRTRFPDIYRQYCLHADSVQHDE